MITILKVPTNYPLRVERVEYGINGCLLTGHYSAHWREGSIRIVMHNLNLAHAPVLKTPSSLTLLRPQISELSLAA